MNFVGEGLDSPYGRYKVNKELGRVKTLPYEREASMYLSIGNDMAVRDRSIIGIFDLDNTSTSKRTREFLEKNEQEGQVVPCDDLPKSFVLTVEYGFERVYLTSLASATLEKRLK